MCGHGGATFDCSDEQATRVNIARTLSTLLRAVRNRRMVKIS
jgi:hypothetical protein